MEQNKPIKGLGDRVKDAIHSTGLNKLAETYTKTTGKDCGCKKRQLLFNEWYSGHKDIKHYTKHISKPDVPGKPQREDWYKVRGLNNPIVQIFIQKARKLDWSQHNLWFAGGILHDWFTKDIDCIITGPYEPERIHQLQFGLILKGFNVGLYPDVIYTDENWDHVQVCNKWLKTGETTKQKWYYSHNRTVINKDKTYCFSAEGIQQNKDGFWVKELDIPYKDLQQKYNERNYQHPPLKII